MKKTGISSKKTGCFRGDVAGRVPRSQRIRQQSLRHSGVRHPENRPDYLTDPAD
jgi:hypothetical protein